MTTTTFEVTGMTCGHCVSAVTSEILSVAGVTEVEVDLGAGAVTVSCDHPVDRTRIRAAVEEAGYQLTD